MKSRAGAKNSRPSRRISPTSGADGSRGPRAQGLSRKGIEIEIPERFEAMTIARDREQELLRALVERLEVLDQILEGYRGSRKLREVHHELA